MRAQFGQWLSSLMTKESHRAAARLMFMNYAAQIVRAAGAFVLRAVLSAHSVGVIATVQIASIAYAAVSTGLVYRSMRDLPNATPDEQRQSAATAVVALASEAVLVCIPYVAILYFLLPQGSMSFLDIGLAAVFSIAFRLLGAVENTLSATGQFDRINLLRLFRSMDSVVGVFCAWIFESVGGFLLGLAVINAMALVYAVAPFDWSPQNIKSAKLLRHGGRYGLLIASDKMAGILSQQVDSLVVLFLAGPASLAGYYLGVNLRGALLQVAQAAFWVKWSSAVREYDRTGLDTYTTVRLTLALGAGTLGLLTALSFLGAAIISALIPAYAAYMPVIVIAASAAIPFGISANLRSRHFLTQSVHILPILSLLRVAAFGLICMALSKVSGAPLGLETIAWAAFSAAGLECAIYAAINARGMRRLGIFVAAAGICLLAALVTWGLAALMRHFLYRA